MTYPPLDPSPSAECAPARASYADMERLRQAATLARVLYPGPVGELVYGELRTWQEFGYRFGGTLVHRLVDHLINKAEQEE